MLNTFSISLAHANNVISSAKLPALEFCIANTKLLMNLISNKGPGAEA